MFVVMLNDSPEFWTKNEKTAEDYCKKMMRIQQENDPRGAPLLFHYRKMKKLKPDTVHPWLKDMARNHLI